MKPVAVLNAPIIGWLMLSLLVVGCQGPSQTERETKREQDRQAMRLADAERDRDTYKSQLDATKANFVQAYDRQKAAEAQLTRAQADLAAARSGQANLEQVSTQLRAAQQQLTDSQNRIREMQIQIDALKAPQAAVSPANAAPSTRPMADGLSK